MKQAITYTEWAKQHWVMETVGNKCLVADALLMKSKDAFAAISKQLISSLTRYLQEHGQRYGEVVLCNQRDAEMRADEIAVCLDAIQGDHPLEYLNVAYSAWQTEQGARIAWENKSLWGYIKWWVKRKLKK